MHIEGNSGQTGGTGPLVAGGVTGSNGPAGNEGEVAGLRRTDQTNGMPQHPDTDDSGKIHDDIPEEVPKAWGEETVKKAIEAVEGSIAQREWENGLFGNDPGHDERIAKEQEWLDKLNDRLRQLCQATVGAVLMGLGTQLVISGATGSAVLVADDGTIIGICDDPLLVVTGGVMVIGGSVYAIGAVVDWATSW